MAIDPRIEEAIRDAVIEAGQSDALVRKLLAWMNAVVSGNEDVNDRQSAQRHLELLFEETQVNGLGEDRE